MSERHSGQRSRDDLLQMGRIPRQSLLGAVYNDHKRITRQGGPRATESVCEAFRWVSTPAIRALTAANGSPSWRTPAADLKNLHGMGPKAPRVIQEAPPKMSGPVLLTSEGYRQCSC